MITKNIEAEGTFGFGRAQVVRCVWDQPIDVIGAAAEHRVELAMLPRSEAAQGCFPEHQAMQRFEPMGEVFFFPAGELVHARSQCRHQHSVVCTFEPRAVERWFQAEMQWTDARLQASLNITHRNVRDLLARLGTELSEPGFAGTAMVELLASQLGIELARYLINVEERPYVGGLSARNLRRIDERLMMDGAAPTLRDLAALCGLSVRHLTRAFRISRRRSIGDYMAACRMQRAKALLVGGCSVKSIAYTMGFHSPAALSTAFRRATGERPRDYLQRVGRPRSDDLA
jgi:AraC family transcriptional regulator